MQSKTDLANYALLQMGEGFQISDFDTDQSEEGQVIRATYDGLIEEKLRERRWNRFIRRAGLALVANNPTPSFSFSYRYPSNCLDFHRFDNGDRSGLNVPPVVFELSNDDQGLLLLTDWPGNNTGVFGEWTLADPPMNLWSSDFKTAFAFEWASIIAPSLLKGSSQAVVAKLEAKAGAKWKRAKSTDYREQHLDRKPKSRIQRARNNGSTFVRRFNDAPAQ